MEHDPKQIVLDGVEPDIQDLLKTGYLDTFTYLKMLYPKRYNNDTSAHRAIFSAIDALDERGHYLHKYVVIKAPRGIGKSTIAKGVADKRIRYKQSRYIVYIGKNATFAEKQTDAIKRSITQNKIGQQIFGPIKASASEATRTAASFGKQNWITSNGVMVFPRGWKQPVRGEIFDWEDESFRPDTIICDDLEDKEEILNEETRAAIKERFYSDVMNCVSQDPDANFQFIYIDTLKHNDSLLQELLDDPTWFSVELAVCDENYKTLIPTLYPQERVDDMVQRYRDMGKLGVFYREFMGIATSQEDISFKKKNFKYYNESDEWFKKILNHPDTYTLILVDPAKAVKLHSAESAIVVVTVNMVEHAVFMRGGIADKLHPDELYDSIFRLYFEYNADVIGIEQTGLSEFIQFPVHTKARELGVSKKCIYWLNARKASAYGREGVKGKIARIGQLASFYMQGRIYHNENNALTERLEEQLLTFPRAKLVDISDAFAYWIQLLEVAEIYFEDRDWEEEPDNIEDEYKGLYTSEELIALEYDGII